MGCLADLVFAWTARFLTLLSRRRRLPGDAHILLGRENPFFNPCAKKSDCVIGTQPIRLVIKYSTLLPFVCYLRKMVESVSGRKSLPSHSIWDLEVEWLKLDELL